MDPISNIPGVSLDLPRKEMDLRVRDRILLYARGLDLAPQESVALALESLQRCKSPHPRYAEVFECLHAILREQNKELLQDGQIPHLQPVPDITRSSMLPEELAAEFREKGIPAFRAKQVSQWLNKGVQSFEEMRNLPSDLRLRLGEEYSLYRPAIIRKQVSAKDGTIKYLWGLSDGNAVETVVMKYRYGNTVCISTQVGCRQGCAFCASTIGGLVRQMEPSEMLNEVVCSQMDSEEKISHIVLMGTGEPLDNFENVIRFLSLINHPEVFNLSLRHVSLSTCGLVERFPDLAERDLQLTQIGRAHV